MVGHSHLWFDLLFKATKGQNVKMKKMINLGGTNRNSCTNTFIILGA